MALTAKLAVSWSLPILTPAFITAQIVDPVENRFAVPGVPNEEIVHADAVGFTLASPAAAAILEIPHQLLLLRVHGDGRMSAPLRACHGGRDVSELRIPIGMLPAFPAKSRWPGPPGRCRRAPARAPRWRPIADANAR